MGSLRFYDRKEVKDLIAYLRLIQNPSDNLSARRVLKSFSHSWRCISAGDSGSANSGAYRGEPPSDWDVS